MINAYRFDRFGYLNIAVRGACPAQYLLPCCTSTTTRLDLHESVIMVTNSHTQQRNYEALVIG